jgi:hypothetical protein
MGYQTTMLNFLTIKDINLQTVNHHSYNIRNINKCSTEEFKNRMGYESWDSIFGNNDNIIMLVSSTYRTTSTLSLTVFGKSSM